MAILCAHTTDRNAAAVTAGAFVRAQMIARTAGDTTPSLAERFLR